jgi:Uma2 family endonuclease
MSALLDQRKVWTREDAALLSELFPHERLELIEGDLITKMGQKPPHAYVVALLTQLLVAAFPERVRVQLAISVPDPYSEPEPDLAVLQGTIREFMDRHPGPSDIALVIEVADTSLALDRNIKYRLYARAGIAEYWIIDIAGRRAIVCRRPDGDEYRSVVIYEGAEEFGLASFRCSTQQILPGDMRASSE